MDGKVYLIGLNLPGVIHPTMGDICCINARRARCARATAGRKGQGGLSEPRARLVKDMCGPDRATQWKW